jgi:hypothetical protein
MSLIRRYKSNFKNGIRRSIINKKQDFVANAEFGVHEKMSAMQTAVGATMRKGENVAENRMF